MLEKIIATWQRTVFEGDNDYAVCVFNTNQIIPKNCLNSFQQSRRKQFDKKNYFSVVGYGIPKTKSIDLELTGNWEQSKYGYQFKVDSYSESFPQTVDGIISYLSSGLIKGIGTATAKTIVETFGLQTLEVFENTPDDLLTIKGISKKKLKAIISSYNETKEMKEIVGFLKPFGITPNKAAKIRKEFSGNSLFVIKNEPYRLLAISGFAFRTVDDIARKTGCEMNGSLRIKGAILHVLNEANHSGDLYLPQRELMERAYELLNDGFNGTEVVSRKLIADAMCEMASNKELCGDYKNAYLPFNYYTETKVSEKIAVMLKSRNKNKNFSSYFTKAQKELNISLAKKQIQAVDMVFSNNVSIITGGPGTGKTTVLKVIINIIRQCSEKATYYLAAPTGRAAKRMAESTGCPYACTIHSLLGLTGEEKVDNEDIIKNQDNLLNCNYLIIDELSMCDMRIFYEVMKSIRTTTKLILIGDPQQLPSVGAGNVLHELIKSNVIPVTKLETIYRQEGTSRIVTNAAKINHGNSQLDFGNDFQLINEDLPKSIAQRIHSLYVHELNNGATLENLQILSPMRKNGECSVNSLNEKIRELINPANNLKKEFKSKNKIFRVGDKVLQTKNNAELGISNGDLGIIIDISVTDDTSNLMIDFGLKEIIAYSTTSLDNLELAYATTIHKSQGSEYDTVIIPVTTAHYVMLQRNLIYTGITRAKKKVILVGQKKALGIAVKNNAVVKRNTALAKRIVNEFNNLKEENKQQSKDDESHSTQLSIAL